VDCGFTVGFGVAIPNPDVFGDCMELVGILFPLDKNIFNFAGIFIIIVNIKILK
jgi:hypothetical protein